MKTFPQLLRSLFLVCPLLIGLSAHGQEVFKANNTTDLNLAGSWVADGPPGATNIAVWDGVGGTVALGGSMSWLGIRTAGGPGGVPGIRTISATSGAVLSLGSGGFEMTTGTQANFNINAALHLAANQTWKTVATRTVTTGSGMTGNVVWTIQGEGTVSLGANTDFTGTYFVDGGNLYAGAANSLKAGILMNGGTLDVRQTNQSTSSLNGNASALLYRANTGNTRLTVNNTTDDTFAGTIDNIALTKSGSGSLTLTGNANLSASPTSQSPRIAVIVAAGSLLVSDGGTLTATSADSNPGVRVDAGGVLGGNGGAIDGSVSALDGSAFEFVLSDPAETNLALTGELTLAADVDLKLSLDQAPLANDTFVLLSGAGVSPVDTFATINGAAFGPDNTFTLSFDSTSYDFQLLYGSGFISAQVIPEPSSLLLMLSVIGFVLWRTAAARFPNRRTMVRS